MVGEEVIMVIRFLTSGGRLKVESVFSRSLIPSQLVSVVIVLFGFKGGK